MKPSYRTFALSFGALVCLTSPLIAASAAGSGPKVLSAPLEHAFVPKGFHNNDPVQFMVAGRLPDTCYKIGTAKTKVDPTTQTVEVRQEVYHQRGLCLRVIVPFAQEIQLGMLPEGAYDVVDGATGRLLGHLPVKKATVKEISDAPMFAQVASVSVETDPRSGETALQLAGSFPNTCLRMKEVRLDYGADTVTVEPFIETTDDLNSPRCRVQQVPFAETVALSKDLHGSHLIHVRVTDGKALQQMVDF